MKKKVAIVIIALSAVAVTGGATTIAIMYMPRNVTLKSNCLEIINPTTARLASDFKCSFKIKDDCIQTRYMDNIEISSIKVNGKEIPAMDYSFIYQTNAKNELTINKKHLGGNVEINADLVTRTQSQNCFFYEYDIEQYASFDDLEIIYPTKKGTALEAIDFTKTKSIDDIYMYPEYDFATLHGAILGMDHNIFVVREDNTFSLKIKAKDGMTLPKNIWYRSNARYTRKDIDFTLEYSNDYKEAILTVPYFFVRDNGSIRVNPDVEP